MARIVMVLAVFLTLAGCKDSSPPDGRVTKKFTVPAKGDMRELFVIYCQRPSGDPVRVVLSKSKFDRTRVGGPC